MKKTILVVGGAGYIGSHTAYLLEQAGFQVIILDNLLHGQAPHPSIRLSSEHRCFPPFGTMFLHRDERCQEIGTSGVEELDRTCIENPFVPIENSKNSSGGKSNGSTFIKADFADHQVLSTIFSSHNIHAVMHFAAFIEVGESVKRPADFYHNNVTKTLQLLDVMRQYDVNKFIFSSSCAVYGIPQQLPLTETHPFAPINPYGKNKLVIEYALQDYATAYGLQSVSLRYFNAAGALPELGLGEQHQPETHVIPLLLRSIKNKTQFNIFGDQYPTRDGTCVRDYVHVLDIAQAHVLALHYLDVTGKSDAFNLGSETGYTVRELIMHAQSVAQLPVTADVCPARAGDVPVLVADATKAKTVLGWKPEHSDINNIMKSAWQWEMSNNIAQTLDQKHQENNRA